MRINEIIWPEDRIEHIALHKVEPYEVEEVCFGQSLIFKAKSKGENPKKIRVLKYKTFQGRHKSDFSRPDPYVS